MNTSWLVQQSFRTHPCVMLNMPEDEEDVQRVCYTKAAWFNHHSRQQGVGSVPSPCDDSGNTSPSAGSHRILLVEDNPDVADSTAMLLKLFGHEVLLASDGEQGVATAMQERPTAILLDIGLPKMNGYEACRAIRAAGLADIPIIAVTGYNRAEDRQKSVEAGFNQHMPKPVDMDELVRLLSGFPGKQ